MRKTRRGGFTLIELLVVAILFGVIGTVVALLFTRGNSTYRHSESHIEMQRTGRNAVGRITPYVSSMFNTAPGVSPVAVPQTADPNAGTPNLIFMTTEDWLNASYPSQFTSSTLALSTADLRRYVYQIRLDGNGNVLMERGDPAAFDPNDPVTTFSATDDRVLYRRKQDEQINDFLWTLVRANLLQLTFTTATETRSDSNQPMTVTEDFRITFNLPTKNV